MQSPPEFRRFAENRTTNLNPGKESTTSHVYRPLSQESNSSRKESDTPTFPKAERQKDNINNRGSRGNSKGQK